MQTIDDLLPPQADHDQFALDLVNAGLEKVEQHYQHFQPELALQTDVHDVEPQLAFELDGHQLTIQYTPFNDRDERQTSIKLVRFDGQACDVQLYVVPSVVHPKENTRYVYAVVNIRHDEHLEPTVYPQTFRRYQVAVNFAKQEAETHLQDYENAEIKVLRKSNDQPTGFLIQTDHQQLEEFTINQLEVES